MSAPADPAPGLGLPWYIPGPSSPPATEVAAWRAAGARALPYLEALLAAQGEAPDADLLSLQHALVDLLRPASVPRATAHSNADDGGKAGR